MCQDNLKAFYEIFKREDFIKNEDIFCPTSFIVSTFESDKKTCKHHNQVIVIPRETFKIRLTNDSLNDVQGKDLTR
jgi:predicted nucleic acid-binding Zn finger protein